MELTAFRQKYNYAKSTPVMRQYLDIKFANIDCLVLFRIGDFYELFYEDAITASRVLDIALTKRGKTADTDIAMCGVPHHALENYLNKLLEEGFKVAICDQLETPEEAKKRGGYKAIVQRNVTRIITPGTIIEESLLTSGEPNYLASLVIDKKQAAICYVDLSTSEIFVISIPEHEIINELGRLSPKEILLSDKYRAADLSNNIRQNLRQNISFQVDSMFVVSKCEKIILDYYSINSTNAIGELSKLQKVAIGNIIEYLTLTQKSFLPKLPLPKIIQHNKFMNIDQTTRSNLEINKTLKGKIQGSLFGLVDKTMTKAGSRLLYNFLTTPIIDRQTINTRLGLTEFFYNNLDFTKKIRLIIKNTTDLKRCLTKLNMKRATARDLLSVKYTVDLAGCIYNEFTTNFADKMPSYLGKLLNYMQGGEEISELITYAICEDAPENLTEGGIIKHSFNERVKELHELINNNRSHINALRDKYRSETGIENLKITTNNVLGLFIDITSKNSSKMEDDKFIHRQTTANSMRYTTEELKELETNIQDAKVEVVALEKEIFYDICKQILKYQDQLILLASSLSRLDVFMNLAIIASEYEYVKPEITDDMCFAIVGGRHPIVENALKKEANSFIANNCNMSADDRIWLITGPNMAGKSTFLRQNALIAILAHIGSFVPAKSAKIGIVDKIFSRIGAGDNLASGQSTFMVEMLETSAILNQSTNRSLIILDEVGRGTATYDGVAIAWSVLEHIHDKLRCRCLFATHYHELTSMEDIMPALTNYTIAVDESENTVLFLHKIIKGVTARSYGVHVAELAGLPKSVIRRANELLKKLETQSVKQQKKIMKTESNNMSLFNL
ncbi:MAG: DNA mismatch repair protein MutS [Rickettsiaceae bacterium]|nr:DNA mismatch repair protein MutS [Rickettsiaceae bacterium]